jgi:hypothetical protein
VLIMWKLITVITFVVLLVAKVGGVLDISWWWVFSPVIAYTLYRLSCWAVVLLGLVVGYFIVKD